MKSGACLALVLGSLVLLAMPGTAAAGSYPFRDDYVKTTTQHIVDVITKDKKAVTENERTATQEHWNTSMRVIRAREVADGEKDAATVARADALLKKVDAAFFKKLTKLNSSAPVEASLGAPKVLSPTAGQSMPLDGAFSITLAPYKNATSYFCSIRQGKQEWSNMHAPSSTPACALESSDPHHKRFKAGAAEAIARALVKGAWSDEVKVQFQITGTAPAAAGAAPPAATSGSVVAAGVGAPGGASQESPPTRGTGAAQFDNVYDQNQGTGGYGAAQLCPRDFSLKVSGGSVSGRWTPAAGTSDEERPKGSTPTKPVTPGGTFQGTVSASGVLTASIVQDPAVAIDGNFHCSSQGCYVNLGAKKGEFNCDMKILSHDWEHIASSGGGGGGSGGAHASAGGNGHGGGGAACLPSGADCSKAGSKCCDMCVPAHTANGKHYPDLCR